MRLEPRTITPASQASDKMVKAGDEYLRINPTAIAGVTLAAGSQGSDIPQEGQAYILQAGMLTSLVAPVTFSPGAGQTVDGGASLVMSTAGLRWLLKTGAATWISW